MENNEEITTSPSKSHKYPNIVMLGMMGSGKTSLGRMLARQIGYGFLDLDEWIEKKSKKKISEIFEKSGEQHFRELEKKAVDQIAGIKNHVISIGGGALASEDNLRKLREIGQLVWVSCPVGEITHRFLSNDADLKDRPLLKDLLEEADGKLKYVKLKERLSILLRQRKSQYEVAEIVFENSYSTIEAGTSVLKEMLFLNGIIRDKRPRYLNRSDF